MSQRKIRAPSTNPAREATKMMAADAKALNTTPVSNSGVAETRPPTADIE